MGYLKRKMWAGIMEDRIHAEPVDGDPYLPIAVALFPTKAAALKCYQTVVPVDLDSLLAVQWSKTEKAKRV
jgi:hypothetical protein